LEPPTFRQTTDIEYLTTSGISINRNTRTFERTEAILVLTVGTVLIGGEFETLESVQGIE
jgi:hypothetical protein